jgi:uncharacterized protein (TIGR02246 family)
MVLLIVAFLTFAFCAAGQSGADAIRHVLNAQVKSWNDGDIEGYMRGYWESDSTMFVSGGNVSVGYRALLERYRKSYPTKETMGLLAFEELSIRVLSSDVAVATGIWRLKRKSDSPWGRFTLLLEKKKEGWRIVYDHTSTAAG